MVVGVAASCLGQEHGAQYHDNCCLQPLKNDRFVIPKSRYDSISSYLSTQPLFKDKYNDTPLVLDQKFYDELVAAGIAQSGK
jgi:hypothetical protein